MTTTKKTPAEREATADDDLTAAEIAAAAADAYEVETVDFEVTIRGTKITLTTPASMDDAPLSVIEAFEDGKTVNAFMQMIGPAQAAKLRASGVTAKMFADVVVPAWNEATGLGEG